MPARPLTSLAGLFHGDDIIQTCLATGGLMASAVPVLTLMLVYGGAISANFFATRLQGEDVVMERQASGSAMNPVERLHIDPLATHNPTVGLPMQTGASARLPAYNISSRVGQMEESAYNASQQAGEQFRKQAGANGQRDLGEAAVSEHRAEWQTRLGGRRRTGGVFGTDVNLATLFTTSIRRPVQQCMKPQIGLSAVA